LHGKRRRERWLERAKNFLGTFFSSSFLVAQYTLFTQPSIISMMLKLFFVGFLLINGMVCDCNLNPDFIGKWTGEL
jgi:hypothetical protein